MKKYIFSFISLLASSTVFSQQGFHITLQAPQYKSGIVYLTYYMGGNLNVADSAAFSNTGTAVFKGNQKLPGGIYVIVFPEKRLRTDFLIDKEQNITVKTDTTDLLNKTIVTGSPENNLYVQYQKFVDKKGRQLEAERNAYSLATTRADSAQHEANYNLYNNELNAYRDNIIKTQPNAMMTALLKAMKDPKVPITIPVTHEDTIKNYYYYKSHYWDGVSFMDERIVRTPFFIPKLERYYREVLSQAPDSLIKDMDYKLLLARSCPEMYKALLNWFTDEYYNPKYMGQDVVFAHLFEKYHSQGVSKWLNDKQMETISRRYYMIVSNTIGSKAANLEMIDSTGKPSNLYDLSADYTVICFWDPNCGHCKEEVPRLDSIYQANWKKHNVKVYGVLTPDNQENAKTEWIKFIKEHHLGDWTNVYKTKAMEDADFAAQKPSFRQLYDVTVTPTIFLLDKNKMIIAKKLSIFQMNDLLEYQWKNKKQN